MIYSSAAEEKQLEQRTTRATRHPGWHGGFSEFQYQPGAELYARGVNRPFAAITFDFALPKAVEGVPITLIDRLRAKVA